MDRLLYFAYGSNMCLPRLRARTPSCRVEGRAALHAHELRFHKIGRDGSAKCDAYLTGLERHRVEGVVYSILSGERAALDEAEDLGRGYDACWVEVESASRMLEVLTYRALPQMIDSSLKPFDWYHAFVVEGAVQHALGDDYIDHLKSVPCVSDPDLERRLENRRVLIEG